MSVLSTTTNYLLRKFSRGISVRDTDLAYNMDIIDAELFKKLPGPINVETLAATRALLTTDYTMQWFDPDGSDRDVTLPAEASSTDLTFIILNTANGAGEDLVVKNDTPATIATLAPGMTGIFSCDGTDWKWEGDIGILYDAVNDTITASAIESSPIGGTTPAAGAFTTLKASTDPVDAHGVGDRAFNDARYCLEANNLSDVAAAATAFANIKQAATESATGVLEKATTAEVVTGTDTDRAVTPAGVTARMGAPGEIGGTTPAAATFTDLVATHINSTPIGDITPDDAQVNSFAVLVAMLQDVNYAGFYNNNQQNIPDLMSKGPGYWFDGTDDEIVIADNANLDFDTDDDFYIEMEIMPADVTRTTDYLINKEAGGIGYGLYLNEDDLYIRLDDGTHDVSAIIGTAVFTDQVKAHILVSFDRSGNATAYVNGVNVGTVDISSVTDTIANAGALHIGNDSAGANEFNGEIYPGIRTGNTTITTIEAKAFASGIPVPYLYRGASQAEHLSETDFATHANWDVTNDFSDTVPGNNATYTWTANQTSTLTQTSGNMVIAGTGGKRYRFIYTVAVTTAPNGDFALTLTNAFGESAVTLPFTAGTHTVEFTSKLAPTDFVISATDTTATEGTFSIDDVSLIQIGTVLQLEHVGHAQAQDISGNELHASVSGALPINLPVDHQEKYIDLAVTGDTNFTLPKGYLISSIVLNSDGAIGGGIDIGTSDGGGEIVTAQAIAGAGTVLCTLVTGANYNTTGADDIIYITDADGTGWDSATVIVRVQMQRVALD